MSYTYVRARDRFKGWLRDDVPADVIAEIVDDFDVWVRRGSARFLKNDGKSQVVQQVIEDSAGKCWDLVIKRVKYGLFLRRLGFLVSRSPAIRSFRGAFLLKEKNIPTAAPVAAVEPWRWQALGTSYYVAETVNDARNLRVVLHELQEKRLSGNVTLARRRLLRHLSAFFCRVHGSGIYHRDLKDANILVRNRDGESFDFVLVDLDGVSRSRTFSWHKRIKNLTQICRSPRLSYRDKIFFLGDYSRRCGISNRKMKTLARRIVTLTTSRVVRSPP